MQRRWLQIQQHAPPFSAVAVVNKKFETVKLENYKGKYLVCLPKGVERIAFSRDILTSLTGRKNFCMFGCYEKNQNNSKDINCEVVGASIDSHFTHLAWIETPREKGGLGDMKIPLLADINKQISKDYGCLLDDGFTVRATYIIDSNGKVRHISLNDRPVGRSVDEVLRLVQAFQFVDKHAFVKQIKLFSEATKALL
ncbi:thioredoxin-dependent peroxide reductase-like protein, partial [Reticulomyxa filosa]